MPEIQNRPLKSSDCFKSQKKPVIQSQTTLNIEFFSLLASVNSSKIPELKNYK